MAALTTPLRAALGTALGPVMRSTNRAVLYVVLPSQFNWFTYTIYKDADGIWRHTYDHAAVKPTGGTRYYVSKTGSDAADGLTPATAFATFRKAYTQTLPNPITMVEGGNWPLSKIALPLTNLKRNLAIDCLAGSARGTCTFLGCELGVTWTASGTVANAWEYENASVVDAWDYTNLTADGDATEALPVASAALVGTTPNSIFVQVDKEFTASIAVTTGVMTVTAIASGSLATNDKISGLDVPPNAIITGQLTGTAGSTGTYSTNLTPAFAIASTTIKVGKTFARTFDSRQPDDNFHANLPSNFQIRNATGTVNDVWTKGIGWEGIQNLIFRVQSGFQLNCYLDSGTLKYNKNAIAAIQFLGTKRFVTNFDAAYALRDIFNDHVSGGFVPLSFSWGNSGRYAGYRDTSGANNNNVYTNHDSGSWIGGYDIGHHAKGPVFAFVDNSPSLTTAVLFGCDMADSTMDTAGTLLTSGAATTWALDCVFHGARVTDTTTSGSGHINIYNSTPAVLTNNGAGGALAYFPSEVLCLAAT